MNALVGHALCLSRQNVTRRLAFLAFHPIHPYQWPTPNSQTSSSSSLPKWLEMDTGGKFLFKANIQREMLSAYPQFVYGRSSYGSHYEASSPLWYDFLFFKKKKNSRSLKSIELFSNEFYAWFAVLYHSVEFLVTDHYVRYRPCPCKFFNV